MDAIIRNANIDGKIVDIGLKGKKIVAIEDILAITSINEFDAKGNIVIPGFIDSHLHLDKCLLNERQPYQDLSGPEKGRLTREEKANFTVADIINRAERVIKQGINAGNYAIRTNVDVDPIVGLKGIEALLTLKERYRDLVKIQITAFSQEGMEKYPETLDLLEEALKMGADLVGGHTIVDSDGKHHIDQILSLAIKYDVEAEFHLDESGKKEHYLLPYLVEKMLAEGLHGRVNAIHSCTLGALDSKDLSKALDLIVSSGLKMTIAPTAISTRQLAPAKELIDRNIIVGIGSDNIRDFFNPLGSGDIRQAAQLLAYVQRFFTDKDITDLWEMITSKGASLLKLDNYGIKPGNEADLVVIDAKSPKEALANLSPVQLIIKKGNYGF